MNKQNSITFKSDLLGESYIYHKHESGVSIYVFPKEMTTSYALFAADFGSVDSALDADGQRPLPDGIAHFLEHKLFSNADGTDSFERFAALGADANAYTSHTRTVYLFSCTEHFEESFAELIDFVTHPYFTPETVAKEQGIIGEEIRMCRDNPYDRCYYNMLAGLYKDHPVKKDICGSITSIASITDQTLYEAYNTYYRPENMTLVVCGNVDADAVLALADVHLPQRGQIASIPRFTVKEAPYAAMPYIEEVGQVAKPVFSIGVKDTHIPGTALERLKRDAGMAVLSEMLFSEAGALYNELYDEGLISPEFSTEYVLTRDFAFLQLAGESAEPKKVFEKVNAYLAERIQQGLNPVDFERCRRIEYAEYIKSFDSTEEIANTLLSFAIEDAALFSYADVIDSIDLDFVEQLMREVFDPAAMTLSVVLPTEGGTCHE